MRREPNVSTTIHNRQRLQHQMLEPLLYHQEGTISTRASIHFLSEGDDKPEAIVFRHGDGDPDGAGQDLLRFCADLSANLTDTRFLDPTLLAARWVVWDAQNYQEAVGNQGGHRCDFLGVRVMLEDSPDIAYRYLVLCRGLYGKGTRPKVICQQVSCDAQDNWTVKREHVMRRKAKKALAAA